MYKRGTALAEECKGKGAHVALGFSPFNPSFYEIETMKSRCHLRL